MTEENERPEERLSNSRDKYLVGKDVGVTLSPGGKLGFNEPTLDVVQSITKEPPGAMQFVHRSHEALLIPTKAGAPLSSELDYGPAGYTATCNGRQGIYRNDVPESRRGTVRLITTVRTKEEEPQWGPCLAVSFAGAVRVPRHRKKKSKDDQGEAGAQKKGSGKGKGSAKKNGSDTSGAPNTGAAPGDLPPTKS